MPKRSRRIKGAGFLDFFNSVSSKIGSFIKSPTVQSIASSASNFANTDVGKAVVSAGKDIAIAGATGIKDKIVEKITNATATKDKKQASQELADYISHAIATNPISFRTDPNGFMNAAISGVAPLTPVQTPTPVPTPVPAITPVLTPVQTPVPALTPALTPVPALTPTTRVLQDTYGYGIDVKKVNKLLREVSGRGLAKFN